MRVFFFAATLALACLFGGDAKAWGAAGHRIICQIAYDELKPAIRARVDALVAIDPRYRTFPDACTAPDRLPRTRKDEHFVDVPRDAARIEAANPCPVAYRCVVQPS